MGIFSRKTKQDVTLDLTEDPVIDLRSGDRPPVWGFPTRCPACGDYGYLDRIDVRHELMFQHCPTCFERWETPRSSTVADA